MNETELFHDKITDDLIDQYDNLMTAFDNITIWDIAREICYKYCEQFKLQQVSYVDV
jgi:hypothetical protein